MHTQHIRLLDETLTSAANCIPQKCALLVGDEEHSYLQLSDVARRLASILVERGVQRGDRIAIFMNNTFACSASIYGTLYAGAVFVLVNPQTKSDKLRFILQDSGATVLITETELFSSVRSALGTPSGLKTVLCSGSPPDSSVRMSTSVEAFWDRVNSATSLMRPVFHMPKDLAALIYTSGSTGNPKGVMMTHQAMVFAAGSVIQYLGLQSDHRLFNLLPLAYSYGLYHLLMSVHLGATLVLERSFTFPAQAIRVMQNQKVTLFPGVPTVFTILIGLHRRSPIVFPSVLQVTNAAAALPASYNRELHDIFPNARIYRMYGLTECKRVCFLNPELVDAKPDSVGRAIPGTETLLLTEDGRVARPGELGILHVRGPHVMAGYWNQPELTRQMLKDGPVPGEKMLCTHDWFTTDGEGDLYFQGRSDDIIKVGGEKVSPVEVENVLFGMKGVREAAVVGVPHDTLGEVVKAYVVLEEGARLEESDILQACSERLENPMMPREVEFCSELPKTASGKVRKASLREPQLQD